MSENDPKKGEIYYHSSNKQNKYIVLGIHPDATLYEETGKVERTVRYMQLYTGSYPRGTIWTRELGDFTSSTHKERQHIPKFTRIRRASGIETAIRVVFRR